MKPRTRGQYVARAGIAKALAHPSRLLILDAVHEKEYTVFELTELVGADQSTVSKHLAILKSAGLVSDRKVGSMTYCRNNCKCLDEFFECMESVLRANLKAQMRVLAG